VLCCSQANALAAMGKDTGAADLRFSWIQLMVSLSKEEQKISTVLITTDTFFVE